MTSPEHAEHMLRPVGLRHLDYTVLYCTILYCTVLYCTVLYCTVAAVSARGQGGAAGAGRDVPGHDLLQPAVRNLPHQVRPH